MCHAIGIALWNVSAMFFLPHAYAVPHIFVVVFSYLTYFTLWLYKELSAKMLINLASSAGGVVSCFFYLSAYFYCLQDFKYVTLILMFSIVLAQYFTY